MLRRLTSLRNLEAVNVALIWLLFAWVWSDAAAPATWGFRAYGLALVSVILIEGAHYWHLKLRSLRTKRPLPNGFRRRFARFRTLNVVLLASCPLVAGLLHLLGLGSGSDLFFGSLLAGFAVLEHVNYFHVQLMHDNRADLAYLLRHRRLRRAPLADDLRRAR